MSIGKDTLGAAIKQVRVARGLTQTELAKAAGLSKEGKSLALIEQGKRFVSVDTLNALANALDIPPACLAILGSDTIGKNKAAMEFMKSLQNLISTVIVAEEKLRTGNAGEQRTPVKTERQNLMEVTARIRGMDRRHRVKTQKEVRKKTGKNPRLRAKEVV